MTGRIREAQSPQFLDNPSLIERASTMIAERAKGKFLYARIATSNLLRSVDEISEETLHGLLGTDIGGVFEQDLKALDQHSKRTSSGRTGARPGCWRRWRGCKAAAFQSVTACGSSSLTRWRHVQDYGEK